MTHDFLVELGTEELPPTALETLSQAFAQEVIQRLKEKKLSFAQLSPFATPRRLALRIEGLAKFTPEEQLQVWGPPAKIAFDAAGEPTKAALSFASKNGISATQLKTASDGKQDKLLYIKQAGGEASKDLLVDIVAQALSSLPINKRMRWGASRDEFVRPVQWLVLLLDDEVLPAKLYGLESGRSSRGHRFHANRRIEIARPGDYREQLASKGKVMVDFQQRRTLILQQVEQAAAELGGHAVIDDALLNEVTALVEWPVALAGRFEASFLDVPAEALISSMKEHQKYFHLVDEQQQLMPYFITVANIESRDPAKVIDGNERVIRPRLADAKFFFETDKKTSLESRRDKLKTVVFQAELGSLYDKTARVEKLAAHIAQQLAVDSTPVTRAAQLCKSDLISSMVYEFPEMQGIAGYHYALNDGESEAVAEALLQQYQPKFAGDVLPNSVTGAILALADRLDTIVGIFGIGAKPTGSKDPFGLRRASLGALRILVEKSFQLDLRDLLKVSRASFAEPLSNQQVEDDVLAYMIERFRAWFEEAGFAAEVFQAVSAKQLSVPLDINKRVHAVAAFSDLPEAQALAAANKRVSNILAKLDSAPPAEIDPSLLRDEAEKQLAQALGEKKQQVAPLLVASDYTAALQMLSTLRQAIDRFFDDVMVMVEEPALRNNRLALLSQLRELFLQTADISLLAVK
ncbi:MAG: glycine--tRNA ligase subunit beta [Cellvibrionaceae bacterium]|nr:glycine--tRNA ligase subunit beta [Cellvibrionaceae bacterium]